MEINKIIAERIKEIDTTNKELAEKLGVSAPRISELTNRVKYTKVEFLEKVLTELGLTISKLPDTAEVRGENIKTANTDNADMEND